METVHIDPSSYVEFNITAGDSAHSVLYMRIKGTGLARMPPGGSLTAQLISLIKTWIDRLLRN